MKYKIYPCLISDIDQSNVWVSGVITSRTELSIKNPKNGKKIVCDGMNIDADYIRRYDGRFDNHKNKPSKYHKIVEKRNAVVTMSAWYRDKLEIGKTEIDSAANVELEIKTVSKWRFGNRIKACMQHPQVAIRMATWIGIISTLLGVVSVLCGFLSFMTMDNTTKLMIVSGALVFLCAVLLNLGLYS